MATQKIAKILKAHNIPYYVKEGRIYADTMEAGTGELEHVADLTGFDAASLRAFLGY